MTTPLHPLAPDPNPAGRALGGRLGAPPTAPDLTDLERPLAARFAALARAELPPALASRCLELGAPESSVVVAGQVDVAGGASPWRRVAGAAAGSPWARVAALVLAGLGLALAGSSSGAPASAFQGDETFVERAAGVPVAGALQVVDDPSVPLFHGVESFDRLTPAPMVAWTGGGGR